MYVARHALCLCYIITQNRQTMITKKMVYLSFNIFLISDDDLQLVLASVSSTVSSSTIVLKTPGKTPIDTCSGSIATWWMIVIISTAGDGMHKIWQIYIWPISSYWLHFTTTFSEKIMMAYLLPKINLVHVFLKDFWVYFQNIMGFNMFKIAKSAQNGPFMSKKGPKRAQNHCFSGQNLN